MMFQKPVCQPIQTFKDYADKHSGRIFMPFFGKLSETFFFNKIPQNASASPIVTVENNTFQISVENVDFEATNCEADAFFIFVAVHYLLDLEFQNGIEKKSKNIIDNFFTK